VNYSTPKPDPFRDSRDVKRGHPRNALPVISIDREHGGSAMHGGVVHSAIDFSASINPIGAPPAAIEEYHRAAEWLAQYPEPFADALSERIAQWIDVRADHVLVGNGSTQLIHLLARAMRWRRPVVVTPTFSEIANALIVNAPIDHIPGGALPRAVQLASEHNFELRVDDIANALESGADSIFIGRPNSPTGSMLSFDAAAAIAIECARFDAHCIFDEAFIDFADNARSMTHLIARWSKVIVLRSLTKIFAIPGLRLGFIVAEPGTIIRLRDMIEPWSVNLIAARVGAACLTGADEFILRTRELIGRERAYIAYGFVQNPHLRVFPSAANFLMIAVRETGGQRFGDFMMRRAIAVRDLRLLPGCGAGMYRVGIRNHHDNDRLIAAARDY
jgi:threonine-phosphate decarboxylase